MTDKKKITIEDLIRDIRREEAERLTPDLGMAQGELSEDLQNRIIQQALQIPIGEGKTVRTRKRKKKKWLFLLLAATLVIGSALTATAAAKNDWDIALMNFMGISDTDTVQLPSGTVELKASSQANVTDYQNGTKSKMVTMRATTSVGDKNSAYVRIDTDYTIPKDYNEKTDYILPENMSINISRKSSGTPLDNGTTWTSGVENGKLYLMIYISNCEGLNKSYVEISVKNLMLYHDNDGVEHEKESRICEGVWTLNWKYSYRGNVKTVHPMQELNLEGRKSYMTKLELSPISIRASGIRIRGKSDHANVEKMVDQLKISEIQFTDGSKMKNVTVSSGGCKEGIFWDAYWDLESFGGKSLDVTKIKMIKIGGMCIKF